MNFAENMQWINHIQAQKFNMMVRTKARKHDNKEEIQTNWHDHIAWTWYSHGPWKRQLLRNGYHYL